MTVSAGAGQKTDPRADPDLQHWLVFTVYLVKINIFLHAQKHVRESFKKSIAFSMYFMHSKPL